MRRSKLEMYVDILSVLALRGPLKLTHIMYKANVNCSILKEYLESLIQQGASGRKNTWQTSSCICYQQQGLDCA